jgi:hypothetical protein
MVPRLISLLLFADVAMTPFGVLKLSLLLLFGASIKRPDSAIISTLLSNSTKI